MLQLSHHSHSGKLLPHHQTSYRGLFILLVMVGVVIGLCQHIVHADYIDVSARIPATLPTVAAEILELDDDARFTDSALIIRGSCAYAATPIVVSIFRGGSFLGSAPCQSNDRFNIGITLIPGANPLLARTSNSTGDFGPDGIIRTVYYDAPVIVPVTPVTPLTPETPPVTVGDSSPTTTPPDDSVQPALATTKPQIRSQSTYLKYGPDVPAVWSFAVGEGRGPYHIVIDWGDEQTTEQTIDDDQLHDFSHVYLNYHSAFATLTVTDADGNSVTFTIAVFTPYIAPATTTVTDDNSGGLAAIEDVIGSTSGQLIIEYAAYVGALGIFGLAWYDANIAAIQVAGVHIFPQHAAAQLSRVERAERLARFRGRR